MKRKHEWNQQTNKQTQSDLTVLFYVRWQAMTAICGYCITIHNYILCHLIKNERLCDSHLLIKLLDNEKKQK